MRIPRRRLALISAAGAALVLLGALGVLLVRPLSAMRSDIQAMRSDLQTQRELMRDMVGVVETQLGLTRDLNAVAEEQLAISRDLQESAHTANDLLDRTLAVLARVEDLAEQLVVLTRDLNSKFPDNPSEELPPPD